MVESLALKLAFASRRLNEAILQRVASRLAAIGYQGATPAALDFLGALECGDNHASELARMMGVSRQWLARKVRQFCRLGYLEQLPGTGREKRIVFTRRGEELIADARRELAALDQMLSSDGNRATLTDLTERSERIAATIAAETEQSEDPKALGSRPASEPERQHK